MKVTNHCEVVLTRAEVESILTKFVRENKGVAIWHNAKVSFYPLWSAPEPRKSFDLGRVEIIYHSEGEIEP